MPGPTDAIGAASNILKGGIPSGSSFNQDISSSARAESQARSVMTGNFATGDFSVGGIGGLFSTNGLLIIGMVVAGIALFIYLGKKKK